MTSNNAAIMRDAMTTVVEQGRSDQIDHFFAVDFAGHDTAGNSFGREDFRMGVLEMLSAFSTRRIEIADQVTAGDKVVTRYVVTGRHTGAFRGIPPTGREFRMTGISIDRLAAGQIIENWEVTDDMGLLRQLGLLEELSSPPTAATA